MKRNYLVFDVESIGLHGEGFAVGWVVLDGDGNRLEIGSLSCPPYSARGFGDKGFKWVTDNVPKFTATHLTPWQMRAAFWNKWREWQCKPEGTDLYAECAWPVEARFLAQCVDDHHVEREWHGPYPLHDVASIRLAAGLNPLDKNERLEGEFPEHDPCADARQSARLLMEALALIRSVVR